MAAEDHSKPEQSSLDPHLQERPGHKETFDLYSDSLFREAAIEWLIATDQVIFNLVDRSFSISI
jgi:hypothetical protein